MPDLLVCPDCRKQVYRVPCSTQFLGDVFFDTDARLVYVPSLPGPAVFNGHVTHVCSPEALQKKRKRAREKDGR